MAESRIPITLLLPESLVNRIKPIYSKWALYNGMDPERSRTKWLTQMLEEIAERYEEGESEGLDNRQEIWVAVREAGYDNFHAEKGERYYDLRGVGGSEREALERAHDYGRLVSGPEFNCNEVHKILGTRKTSLPRLK